MADVGRCPQCGKLVAFIFPLHDCVPKKMPKKLTKKQLVGLLAAKDVYNTWGLLVKYADRGVNDVCVEYSPAVGRMGFNQSVAWSPFRKARGDRDNLLCHYSGSKAVSFQRCLDKAQSLVGAGEEFVPGPFGRGLICKSVLDKAIADKPAA